jgi:hypothetical protein
VSTRFLRACSSPYVTRAWCGASLDYSSWLRRTGRAADTFECAVDLLRAQCFVRALGLDYRNELAVSVGALRHLLEGAQQAVVWALQHPVALPDRGGGWFVTPRRDPPPMTLQWSPAVAKESQFTLALKKNALLFDPDDDGYLFAESDEEDFEWKPMDEEGDAVEEEEEEEEEEEASDDDDAVAELLVWERQQRNFPSSFNELHRLFAVLHSWMSEEGQMIRNLLRDALELMERKPHLLNVRECVALKTPLMVLWEAGIPAGDYLVRVLTPLTARAKELGANLNLCDRLGRTISDLCWWNLPLVSSSGMPFFHRDESQCDEWCEYAHKALAVLGAASSPLTRTFRPDFDDNGRPYWRDRHTAKYEGINHNTWTLVSMDEAAALARKAGIDVVSDALAADVCLMFKWAFEWGFRSSLAIAENRRFNDVPIILPEDARNGARLDRLMPAVFK